MCYIHMYKALGALTDGSKLHLFNGDGFVQELAMIGPHSVGVSKHLVEFT